MKLTEMLRMHRDGEFWYRIWGYWRSPGMMKQMNLWSDRKDQQFRSFLNAQRGRGKGRPQSIYEKLAEPKYTIKWVKKGQANTTTGQQQK
jgi:hypothetical protein